MTSSLTSTDLFETEEYSIHRPGSTEYHEALANARKQLAETNCAQLEGFIRPGIITQMQQEAVALAPRATYTRKNLNPYLEEASQSDARDHPRNRFSSRVHGMVRGDLFTEDSVIRAIFDNSDLCRVRRLALRPGDLQLFGGSHTLHRVTAPRDGERLSLLLSYVSDPDHIATAEYARRIWGESHPLHHAAHEA